MCLVLTEGIQKSTRPVKHGNYSVLPLLRVFQQQPPSPWTEECLLRAEASRGVAFEDASVSSFWH